MNLSAHVVSINRRLVLTVSIFYFLPHQLPPTSKSRHFRLTSYGVWLITFLGPEKREDFLEDSSSRNTFNALDTCRAPIGPVSDEGVALSSAHFFSLYIWCILLIPSTSSLLIFERESPSPLIPSIRPLPPSLYLSSSLRPFLRKLTYQ